MIEMILLLIIAFLVFMLVRNEYVFRCANKIADMTYRYHTKRIREKCYLSIEETFDDYAAFNYEKTLFKFWVWDWHKMIPDELVEKIEPFE